MRKPTSLWGDIHIAHDWILLPRLSFEPHPVMTLGTGPIPFSTDLCLLGSDGTFVDDRNTFEKWCRKFAVASDLPTRAPILPAWVFALVEALWRSLPENGINQALEWAQKFGEAAPARAQALLVVWDMKRRPKRITRDDSAIKRLRVLHEAMEELGGANPSNEPSID